MFTAVQQSPEREGERYAYHVSYQTEENGPIPPGGGTNQFYSTRKQSLDKIYELQKKKKKKAPETQKQRGRIE
jgi:hypothetical protein